MKKKIFLSPERRPAPHGKYWGMPGWYEHDVCYDIARQLKPMLEYNGFAVFIAPSAWTMEQRAAYANQNGFDYYLCIHTNAMGNGGREGTATGAECLYYGKKGGASYQANKLVYDELAQLYPSKRGLKDGNNYVENRLTNMVSVYAELAFHDNGRDAAWLVGATDRLAVALCKGMCGYHKVQFSPIPTEEPPQDTPDQAREVQRLRARVVELEALVAKETAMRQTAESRIQAALASLAGE